MSEYLNPTNQFFMLINLFASDIEICRHLNSGWADFQIAIKKSKIKFSNDIALYFETDKQHESVDHLVKHALNYLAKVARNKAEPMIEEYIKLHKSIVYPKGEKEVDKAEEMGWKIRDSNDSTLEELALANLIITNAQEEWDLIVRNHKKKYRSQKVYTPGENWLKDAIRHEKYGRVSK